MTQTGSAAICGRSISSDCDVIRTGTFPFRRGARLSVLGAVTACWLALLGATGSAHAEVDVKGDAASIQVEARGAAIRDILSALARFNVRYRTTVALDQPLTMTLSGPLEQVIARALAGFNYVLKRENDKIEVVVVGRYGSRAVAVEPPRPPPSSNSATGWRSKAAPTKP